MIADFIKIGKLTAVWYNLSEDDSDPILLLQRILEPLSIAQQRQTTTESTTLTQAIEDFVQALDQNSKDDLYIVLDDFHRIEALLE